MRIQACPIWEMWLFPTSLAGPWFSMCTTLVVPIISKDRMGCFSYGVPLEWNQGDSRGADTLSAQAFLFNKAYG